MPAHSRPPWWPEGEAWPPSRWEDQHRRLHAGEGHAEARWRGGGWWGPGRGNMRRGIGCMVAMLSTLIVSVGVVVLWLLAGLLGLAREEGALAYLARPAGLVVLLVGVMALVVGIRLARSVGRPLSDLVDAAGRIEQADYSVRVPEESGRGEMRRLSGAFNAMAARLESEDATRRRLLADVSHELRTPLAVVQGNLEALLDGVYPPDEAHIGPILEETRVLERLIDDLRTLSLAESGALPLHREPTDPVVLLEDVAAAHRARARAAGIELVVQAPTSGGRTSIEIDPVRMHEVISNLVDNAIRAMSAGGTIVLYAEFGGPGDGVTAASPSTAPGRVTITVSDDGPGIPVEIRDHVFDRFTKSASSRGSGLGLAIARAIVEAHGGTITTTSGAGGRGTVVRIHLPG